MNSGFKFNDAVALRGLEVAIEGREFLMDIIFSLHGLFTIFNRIVGFNTLLILSFDLVSTRTKS